jgi:2'-5' RNA ligase
METAIVVAIPELAPVIDVIRCVHTTAGADGIPAHVTLLYPFLDSDLVTPALVERAAAAIDRFAPFDVSLADFRYFDGSPSILYLAPAPAQPFVEMTAALAAAFPEYPPYGGVHSEVIPHVTVAEGDREQLRAFERELAPGLPIDARVDEARLFQRDAADRWQPRERLPLAGVR